MEQGDKEELKEAEKILLKESSLSGDYQNPSQQDEQQGQSEKKNTTEKLYLTVPQSQSTPPDEAIPGGLLGGRYRVDSLLGSGATSSVYKGFDLQLNRQVAIKALHQHLISDEMVVRRFEQEAKTATILVHPNIVAVHFFGTTAKGQPYLIMEFVPGVSLQELVKSSGGTIAWTSAVDICIQVCAALAVAHEKESCIGT